jgi:hypothetical protein
MICRLVASRLFVEAVCSVPTLNDMGMDVGLIVLACVWCSFCLLVTKLNLIFAYIHSRSRKIKPRPPARRAGMGLLVGSQGQTIYGAGCRWEVQQYWAREGGSYKKENYKIRKNKSLYHVPCAINKSQPSQKITVYELKYTAIPHSFSLLSYPKRFLSTVACSFTRRNWKYCRPSCFIEGVSNILT